MSRNLSRLAFMAATVLIGWAAVSLIGSVMMSMNNPEILLNIIIISGAAYSGWILSDMWVDDLRKWFKR
tara:strand:+ start:78 stop:284 length:207 start_codon:yes stop_codon:yes gene_type:complete